MPKTDCIKPLEHKWEYHSTHDGGSYWCCWYCGAVTREAEDTGHGG